MKNESNELNELGTYGLGDSIDLKKNINVITIQSYDRIKDETKL
jgi:hypothetical protein